MSDLLQSLHIPKFEDLTSIDQKNTYLETSKINKVIELLTKTSEEFLAVDIALSDKNDIRFNPMDAVYHTLKNALPESNRILITNLDKMKLALPFVIPDYSSKPMIKMWPFTGITRQTRNKTFNLFHDGHHIIAGVRLGNCHGFGLKLSTSSKSEILNGVFFEGQHRFLSRRHEKLSNVAKKNQFGSIETCIHTPNKKLDKFLQIWNLQGNILLEGIEAQVKLINTYANVIIVVLDDEEDLRDMNREIIKLFGEKRRIIVLIHEKRIETDSSDSENEDESSSIFQRFEVVKFNFENMATMYERTRSLVSSYCTSKSDFTLESIEKNTDLYSDFNIDLKESILQVPMKKVDKIMSKIKMLHREATDNEALQKCFPLYFSKSSIDQSKKIVEHIEHLDKTKIQFFNQNQRGEFEMENEIENQINSLRQQQSRIAHQSILAVTYMNDIMDFQNEDNFGIQNEKIRLYHKLLSFLLARYKKDGIDVVGFQRELGQRFIAMESEVERSKITKTLKRIVEAGVSIELIDGDTQSLNQEIIISLLDSLRFEKTNI